MVMLRFLATTFLSGTRSDVRAVGSLRAVKLDDGGIADQVSLLDLGVSQESINDSLGPGLSPTAIFVRYVYDGAEDQYDARLVSLAASSATAPSTDGLGILAALHRDGVDFDQFYATVAADSLSGEGCWEPLLRDETSPTKAADSPLSVSLDRGPRFSRHTIDVKLQRRHPPVTSGALAVNGFFGIGVLVGSDSGDDGEDARSARQVDLEGLWHSASELGATFAFTVGHQQQPTEEEEEAADELPTSSNHLPLFEHASWGDFTGQGGPKGATWVAVSSGGGGGGGVPLADFEHRDRSVYVLSASGGDLPPHVLEACHAHVLLPRHDSAVYSAALSGSSSSALGPAPCFDAAAAGPIVLKDRLAKQQEAGMQARQDAATRGKEKGAGNPYWKRRYRKQRAKNTDEEKAPCE
mmetsp:Transcript_69444/g.136602  ORF Transcript_69444/g.136602 Transcript_69444/m.136602 type:complete len:410 (+) Transcript_69444:217-1446(+)